MIKRTAVLLLCCYLFSATELVQFLKIPVLISHFIEHKAQQNDLSIWQFLCIHYASGDVHDADYAKDMKLPFKTCTSHVYSQNPFRLESVGCLIPQDQGTEFVETRLNYYWLVETTSSTGLIWQPPKFC